MGRREKSCKGTRRAISLWMNSCARATRKGARGGRAVKETGAMSEDGGNGDTADDADDVDDDDVEVVSSGTVAGGKENRDWSTSSSSNPSRGVSLSR